jgi:hypothetical protein
LTLKKEAILSPETSVHTISTQSHIPEYGILVSKIQTQNVNFLENGMDGWTD